MDPSLNLTTNISFMFDVFCIGKLASPMVWAVFSFPCGLVGSSASVLLLRVLIQRQRAGWTNNMYIINLTVIDLIFNLALIPGILSYFMWQNYLSFAISYFIYCFNLSGRPMFMSCICIDGYMAVVHPIVYNQTKTSKYRVVVTSLVWVLSIVLNGLNIHFWGAATVISSSLSAPVIAFCNISVLCALNKPDPSGRTNVHPQKQRALQAVTHSLVVAMLCYPPLLVHHAVSYLLQEYYCYVSPIVLIIPTLGCTITPLLYLKNLGRRS